MFEFVEARGPGAGVCEGDILEDGHIINFRAFTRYKMSLSSNQYIRGSIRRDISRSL